MDLCFSGMSLEIADNLPERQRNTCIFPLVIKFIFWSSHTRKVCLKAENAFLGISKKEIIKTISFELQIWKISCYS